MTIRRSAVAVCAMAILALALGACSTTRTVASFEGAPADGSVDVVDTDDLLAYTVAIDIEAPREDVWAILTAADTYTEWNSTIVSLDGEIVADGELALVSKDAPDRTFDLTVSEFVPNERMVWEDGMPFGFFAGVRTFTLTQSKEGVTKFTMSEAFSGGMLGMIKDALPDFTESFKAFAADLKAKAEDKSE